MRPYLLFVSGATGLAGLALAPPLPVGHTLAFALVFFLSYGFGQALTDCFQLDTDSLSAPYRPLVQGRIRRRDVLAVSLAGLGASGLVFALHAPATIGLAALAVLGLATYTPFKRRWWAGPAYNAWIVAVLLLLGYVTGVGRIAPVTWSPVLAATLAAVFFAYANFVLAGYFKDVPADRATGYRTLPVVFGWRAAALVSHGLALLALAAVGTATWLLIAGVGPALPPPAAGLLGGGVVATVVAQVELQRVRRADTAHRAVAPVVHAYVLLVGGLAALARPAWGPALLAFYGAFVLVLSRRPMAEQI